MADEILKRDQNHITVLAGITDDVDQDIVMLRVDPITKRLLVKATGGGGGSSVSVNGAEVTNPNFIDSNTLEFDVSSSDVSGNVKGVNRVVVSGNTTATLGTYYISVATATYTDPTPTEGGGFTVLVRNGTSTIGGTAYSTAGSIVHRYFHSGAWANYVQMPQGAMSGDATQSITGAVTIANNVVTDAKFRLSTGLSVVGRSVNSTGNVADITAGLDGQVLRRSGSTIGFGTVATAGITDDAVTYAKMQNVSATARVLGRVSSGAGDVEEIVIDNDLSSVSVNDDTLPSAKATKTYVDTKSFSTVMMSQSNALACPASSTRFLTMTSGGGTYQITFPGLAATYVPTAGVFSRLTIYISTAQPGTGSFVLTAQNNGVDQSLVVTIAAGSAAGFYSDNTNSFSVVAGDWVNLKCVNNSPSVSGAVRAVSCVFTT